MATRTKTVRFAATTRITALASATSLASATRHDFAAFQCYLPETTRTIVSAWIRVTCRDANTTSYDFDGVRIGVRTGAGANPVASASWDDLDVTITLNDSGDHERFTITRDITSYIETRDQSTLSNPTTFDLQIGVAFATEAASNVNGITAEVFITYQYDDSAATHVKTVQIPIQSHHTLCSTTAVEVGTTGGSSDAPANQIPQLTGAGGFLPESGVVIRQAYLVIMANEAGSSGTTDFTPVITVDSTSSSRAIIEQALTTAATYYDIVHLSEVGSPSSASAHAFKAHSDLASRLENLGAILVVTYEFTASSANHLVSIEVPMRSAGNNTLSSLAAASWTDAHKAVAEVNVQEPGTITLKQSGVVAAWFRAGNGPVPNAAADGQTERGYGYVNMVRDGYSRIVHRCDHSSSTWSLSRGRNELVFKYAMIASQALAGYPLSAVAIVNYHCEAADAGCGAHAKTVKFALAHYTTNAAVVQVTPSALAVEASKLIFGAVAEVSGRDNQELELSMQLLSGEEGYPAKRSAKTARNGSNGENGPRLYNFDITEWAKHADIAASRTWSIAAGPSIDSFGLVLSLTYHAIEYTFAGDVLVDGAAPTDCNVDLFDDDGGDFIGRVNLSGSSAYSFTVYEDTRNYFASAFDVDANAGSRTAALPGGVDIDIDISTSTGGSGLASRVVGSPIIRGVP